MKQRVVEGVDHRSCADDFTDEECIEAVRSAADRLIKGELLTQQRYRELKGDDDPPLRSVIGQLECGWPAVRERALGGDG